MLTLEKFEEASEIVKRVTSQTKLVLQRVFERTDRCKGVSEAGKYAAHRSV